MTDGDQQTTFKCGDCGNTTSLSTDVALKRKEVTRLYRSDGIYTVLVCEYCGGLFKPAVGEIMSDTTEAIVMVSGGIDSAVCLAKASDEYDQIKPVHVQYGQQTGDMELRNADLITDWINENLDVDVADLSVVDYQPVFTHFADGVADPDKEFDHLVEDDGRSAGYVPMRNLHLIATGSAFADDRGSDAVILGAQGGDAADYPDCRQKFLTSALRAVNDSLPNTDDSPQIDVRYPLLDFSKEDVLREGDKYNIPWGYTYSCYTELDLEENYEDAEPCGECPACVERQEAFDEAGLEDPFVV